MENTPICLCLLVRCLFSVHSCCWNASVIRTLWLLLHVNWQWSHDAKQETTLSVLNHFLQRLQWWTFTVFIQNVSPLKGETWGPELLKIRRGRWPFTVAINYIVNVLISTVYSVFEAVACLSHLLNWTSSGEKVSLHDVNVFLISCCVTGQF